MLFIFKFLESLEELEESLKVLIIRNNELLELLNKAGIKAPPFTGPKLLRCIVTVQNKEDDAASTQSPITENENNLNKLNSDHEFKSGQNANDKDSFQKKDSNTSKKSTTIDSCQVSLIEKPTKLDKVRKLSKHKKEKQVIEKIVFNKTFGQRSTEGHDKSSIKASGKNCIGDTQQADIFSENSSLEIISILEQTATKSSANDRLSVLPLFTQPLNVKSNDVHILSNEQITLASILPCATVAPNSPTALTKPDTSEFLVKRDLIVPAKVTVSRIAREFEPKDEPLTVQPNKIHDQSVKVADKKRNGHTTEQHAFNEHGEPHHSDIETTNQKSNEKTTIKVFTDKPKRSECSERKRKYDGQNSSVQENCDVIPEKSIKSCENVQLSTASDIKPSSYPLILHSIEKVTKEGSDACCVVLPELKPIGTVDITSEAELPNDLLASLEIPPNDSSHGSLSPTAAFLLSFPVVCSTTSRPIETDHSHQLSPAESGILDLDGKHNMNASDHQLLEKISSLLAATAPRSHISKQLTMTTKFGENDLFHQEIKTIGVVKKEEPIMDDCKKIFRPKSLEKSPLEARGNEHHTHAVKASPNDLNPTIYLSPPLDAVRTVSNKPKDFFESSQTFAEILECLKASPSKPMVNLLKAAVPPSVTRSSSGAKENTIPNFSFSSNTRIQNMASSVTIPTTMGSNMPTTPTHTSSISYGFYETLSSIRPTTTSNQVYSDILSTSALSITVNSTPSSYTFPKLPHSYSDYTTTTTHNPYIYGLSNTSNGHSKVTIKKDANSGELYTSDTLFESAFSSNQKLNTNSATISTSELLKTSKSGTFLYTSPAIQYSAHNTYNPFSYEHTTSVNSSTVLPLSLGQNIGIPPTTFSTLSPISYPHVGYSSTSITASNKFNATLPSFPSAKPKTTTVSSKPQPSFSFDPTFTRIADPFKESKPLSCHQPYQNDIIVQYPQSQTNNSPVPQHKSNKIPDKISDSKITSNPTFSSPTINSSNLKKKPVNWMTSSYTETKPVPAVQLNLNMSSNSAAFMQSSQYRAQLQTPLSFPDDNLPWSPNRLLDPNNFTSAPVLPTLHGDLALNTITAETDSFSTIPNTHSIAKNKMSMTSSNNSPTKNYLSRTVASNKGIAERSSGENISQTFNSQPLVSHQFENVTPSATNQANIFSVSQMVDNVKDHRKHRQTNRKLCYQQKPTMSPYHKNMATQNDEHSRRILTSSNNMSHDTVQPLPSSTFNESFSIPMMTEPMKPPSQQLSNSYSAEALISSAGSTVTNISNNSNPNKRKPTTFQATNSISQEFYNPADSLMDFSSSNDIFNPYFTHIAMPSADAQYSCLIGGYGDISTQQPVSVQDIHLNYESPHPPSIFQTRSMSGNSPSYSQPQITTQFSVLPPNAKDIDLDVKKQVYPINVANVACDTAATNIFTTPLALASPLLNVLPSTTMSFPARPSLDNGTTSRNQHNFLSNSNLQYSNRNTGSFNISDDRKPVPLPTQTGQNSNYNKGPCVGNSSIVPSNYGGGSNSNTLTNFNLSTICPEINHDKNPNWA